MSTLSFSLMEPENQISIDGFITFLLYSFSHCWQDRTVEKVELLSRSEYLHKTSFQIRIKPDLFNHARDFFKRRKAAPSSERFLAESCRLIDEAETVLKEGLFVEIPLVKNPKSPLIDFDISTDSELGSFEVLSRFNSIKPNVDLLDNHTICTYGSSIVGDNIGLLSAYISCYPRHIKSRLLQNNGNILKTLEGEFAGVCDSADRAEIAEIIRAQENRLAALIQMSTKLVNRYDPDHKLSAVLFHPYLAVINYYRIYKKAGGDEGNAEMFVEFMEACESFLLQLESLLTSLKENSKEFIKLLEEFVSNYIFFLRCKVKTNQPYLIKLSQIKEQDNDPQYYPVSINETSVSLEQLRRDTDSKLLKFFLSGPLKIFIKAYFYLLKMPLLFPIDLLNNGVSYHFEFCTKDPDVRVLASVVSFANDRDNGTPKETSLLEDFFRICEKRSGYFHIYTARKEFFSADGRRINPNGLSLIIWPNISLFSPLIFLSVLILEVISFGFFIIQSPYIFDSEGATFFHVGFVSFVAMIVLRYKPGAIADSLTRRWKRSLVVGLTLFVSSLFIQILLSVAFSFSKSQEQYTTSLTMFIGLITLGIWIFWDFIAQRFWYRIRKYVRMGTQFNWMKRVLGQK